MSAPISSPVDDLFGPAPDGEIFHYTTPAGLEGILRGRFFRAKHIRCQSDRREIEWGLGVLRRAAREVTARDRSRATRCSVHGLVDLLRFLTTKRGSPARIHIPGIQLDPAVIARLDLRCYISCFSGRLDIASQWKRYAGGGAGYTVGLDPKLFDARKRFEFRWGPPWYLAGVKYDRQAALDAFTALLQEFLARSGTDAGMFEALDSAVQSVGTPLLLYKDRKFASEAEWRALYSRAPESKDLPQDDAKGRVWRLGLCNDAAGPFDVLPVTRIVCGPYADPWFAYSLANLTGHWPVIIERSSVKLSGRRHRGHAGS